MEVQVLFTALFTLLFLATLYNKRRGQSNNSPPEPPGAWPVIGHLHRLGPAHQIHRQLGAMADDLGPAFVLRLGLRRGLVVSSASVARDCFTGANDKKFSSRPDSTASRLMGYDRAMFGFAPYGPYWRNVRKIATVRLLSTARLDSLRHVRTDEIHRRIKGIYSNRDPLTMESKMDVKKWCGDLTMDVMARMVVGRSVFDGGCDGRRFRESVSRFFYLMSVFVPSDVVPWKVVDWVDVGGYKRRMKETAAEMDGVLAGWLAEHKRRRVSAGGDAVVEEDFMDLMLGAAGEIDGCDSDILVKATCLAMILGGTDTTSVTLAGALFYMLTNRNVLERVQAELDNHVGNDRNVDESDIKNLAYLDAVVKETLRFTPAAPFIVPREATEDCCVSGYRVAAGTQLIVNLWKLQMDPDVWTDPTKFDPDRFLTDHSLVEPKGQHFEYIPFGAGRRSCPGSVFSLQVMHLALARLAHGFRMELVGDGQSDIKAGLSLGITKAAPLEILLYPRLPCHLYD